MNIQAGDRFFFDFEGQEGFLSEEESHHLINVLRKKTKEKIKLINGKGSEYEGEIVEITKRGKTLKVKVKILQLLRTEKPSLKNVLAFVPLLKGNKTEFLIEKGTELGIHKFFPFTSDFTVVKPSPKIIEKLKKKALNALKQSGRLYLPEINLPINLKDFLNKNTFISSLKIVALYEGVSFSQELAEKILASDQIVLLSGPEGGFSKEEINLLDKLNFIFFSISPNILKAETASIALMSFLSILLNKKHET